MTEQTMFEVNNKVVDLKKAFPLTIGDHKKILEMGIDITAIGSNEPTIQQQLDQYKFAEYMLQKANPEITVEDFDTLTPADYLKIVVAIGQLSNESMGNAQSNTRGNST